VIFPGALERAATASRPPTALPLRREIVRDYYPDGKAKGFADAYHEYRSHKASGAESPAVTPRFTDQGLKIDSRS